MNITVLLAAAFMTLSATTAFAEGEGRGNPFEFRSPGLITQIAADRKALPAKSQDPFPFRANEQLVQLSDPEALLPIAGAEGPVQTANSLPPGASNGVVSYEQRRSVLAFLQTDAIRQAAFQMAQKTALAAQRRG